MGLAQISPKEAPRHLKVTGHRPTFGYEPCEDIGCSVPGHGVASSCGRIACPLCGCSGTNLSTMQVVDTSTDRRMRCTCGHAWVHGMTEAPVVGAAFADEPLD